MSGQIHTTISIIAIACVAVACLICTSERILHNEKWLVDYVLLSCSMFAGMSSFFLSFISCHYTVASRD